MYDIIHIKLRLISWNIIIEFVWLWIKVIIMLNTHMMSIQYCNSYIASSQNTRPLVHNRSQVIYISLNTSLITPNLNWTFDL